jgi:hypothetical protein
VACASLDTAAAYGDIEAAGRPVRAARLPLVQQDRAAGSPQRPGRARRRRARQRGALAAAPASRLQALLSTAWPT